ncbi:septum formation protein Maf [bacterium]|nr:septum formation protein Maf [bacterium]
MNDYSMIELTLASASPRRKEILENLGINFSIIPAPDIDENIDIENSSISPSDIALAIALRKSLSLNLTQNQLALTADTVVSIDGMVFGKPKDSDEAANFLRKLSGKRHKVITAIALREGDGEPVLSHESTSVYFTNLCDDDINWYVSTGEPFGKAGGYAIQGMGGIFIERIEGCYFNVVGLPVFNLFQLIGKTGYDYRDLF